MNRLFNTLLITIITSASAAAYAAAEDWSKTAEAAFLTADERRAWKVLKSDEAREEFKDAYWKRRDPDPDTPKNEFRERILDRIRLADTEFGVAHRRGSSSARGLVLVVMGRPSTRQQTQGPIKGAPEIITPGRVSIPNDAFTTTEFHTWAYDRDDRPELLDILGLSHIEVSFIVDPGRRDELQNPGRFHDWQEMIARASLVSK